LDPLKIDEAIEGYSRSTCREAQDLGSLLAVKRLQSSPPPHNDGVRTGVSIILSCGSPLVDVDIGCAGYEKLKFLLVELKTLSISEHEMDSSATHDGDEVVGNYFLEPGNKILNLLTNGRV
jgi:hypothetical protein